MNRLLIVVLVLTLAGCSAHQLYGKIGVGYKVSEQSVSNRVDQSFAHDISCLGELGFEGDSVSYGWRHLSQCFVGYPVNHRKEYSRNSIFLDYKYVFRR